jgi:hypothetical protein
VFVPGKLLQKNLTLVIKLIQDLKELTLEGAPESGSTREGSSLTQQHQKRLERLDTEKHSILFCPIVSNKGKGAYLSEAPFRCSLLG